MLDRVVCAGVFENNGALRADGSTVGESVVRPLVVPSRVDKDMDHVTTESSWCLVKAAMNKP